MTTNVFQQAKKTEHLTWAHQQWELAAKHPAASAAHQAHCALNAKAIRMELEDGVARCLCHLVPYLQCPSLK